MIDKRVSTVEEALAGISDGMTIMFGGFGGAGVAVNLMRALENCTARDLTIVSDMIVNVQTGTGNRIEFWDNHGSPLKSKGKVRRYIDVGRLTKGR